MSLVRLIKIKRPVSEIEKYLQNNFLEIFNEEVLFEAIDNNNVYLVNLIMDQNVDLNKYRKNKKNPFIYAVKNKKYNIAIELSSGINVNLFDEYDQSFLYFLIDQEFKNIKPLLSSIKNISKENINKKNLYNGNDILKECALAENKLFFRYLLKLTNSITYDFDSLNFEDQTLKDLIYENEVSEIINEYNRHFFTNNLKN